MHIKSLFIGSKEIQLKDIEFNDLYDLNVLSVQLNRSTERIKKFAWEKGLPIITIRALSEKSDSISEKKLTFSFLERTKLLNALFKEAKQTEKPQTKLLPKPSALSSLGHRTRALHILQSEKDVFELLSSKTLTLPHILALYINMRLYVIATFQNGKLNPECSLDKTQLIAFDLARLNSFDKPKFKSNLKKSLKLLVRKHSELNNNRDFSVETQIEVMVKYRLEDPFFFKGHDLTKGNTLLVTILKELLDRRSMVPD